VSGLLVDMSRTMSDAQLAPTLQGEIYDSSLYGTLCAYQANSAMMITTSLHSADAKTLARKHPINSH
jgi:hypothetical protein